MLVGAAVVPHAGRSNVEQEIAFLASQGIGLEIRRVFDSGFDRNFMHRAGLDVGKRVTHYSFKPDMGALASGSLDSGIRSFLSTIPRGHQTILTIWHEPEDNFTTAEQKSIYRSGWRRFSELVRETGRSELSTSWVMMGWSWRTASGRQPLDWWPGDGVVDNVGIDVYNEGSLTGTRWDSPGRSFGIPAPGDTPFNGYVDGGILEFLKRHNVSFGVAEFGSLENANGLRAGWTAAPTKAEWIRTAVEFYKQAGAVYVEYFHAGPYRGPWWLDSSQQSLEAYRWAVETY